MTRVGQCNTYRPVGGLPSLGFWLSHPVKRLTVNAYYGTACCMLMSYSRTFFYYFRHFPLFCFARMCLVIDMPWPCISNIHKLTIIFTHGTSLSAQIVAHFNYLLEICRTKTAFLSSALISASVLILTVLFGVHTSVAPNPRVSSHSLLIVKRC